MQRSVIVLALLGLFYTCECSPEACGSCNDFCVSKDVLAANSDSLCKLGLKTGFISNSQMSASSYFGPAANDHHSYKNGRLDLPFIPGVQNGAWSAQTNAAGQWIQVRLNKPTKIVGVVTQGRNRVNQWVRSYKIQYVAPGENSFSTVKDASGHNDVTFTANSDQDTKVTHYFSSPIVAIKLRLVAQTWHGHISLRHEYLTCYGF